MASELKDALLQLTDQDFVDTVTEALAARPDLAFAVVDFAVPALTFPPARAISERRYTGIIKSFVQQKNYGFISCPEVHAIFGGDVWLHGSQYNGQGVGSTVTFAVLLNQDHKPQAFDILSPKDDAPMQAQFPQAAAKGNLVYSGKGCGKALPMQSAITYSAKAQNGKGFLPPNSLRPSRPQIAAPQIIAELGGSPGMQTGIDVQQVIGTCRGVIKSFKHTENGYGFIDCPKLKSAGYNDVFLHREQLGGFDVGSEVAFVAFLNKKGQPQAKDLRDPSAFQEGGKGMQKGMDEQQVLGTFQGVIKSFNHAENGYGFIDCPELKSGGYNDVFLHREQRGEFDVGSEVVFVAFLNRKSQPQAKELQSPSDQMVGKRARIAY